MGLFTSFCKFTHGNQPTWKLRFTKIFKQQIFLDSVSRHDCQLLSIGHATENGAEKTVLFKEPRFWPILFVSKFWPSVSQAYMLGTSNLGTWTINGEVSAWKSPITTSPKIWGLIELWWFFGYPRFLETSSGRSYHNLVVASKIVVSKSDLWYRSLFSFIYHQQRKMSNSFKTVFWFTIPTFSNMALQKKESSAPLGSSVPALLSTPLQALRLEMTEDYYYDLPDRRMCSVEAGGSHLTLADEDLSHRNETGFVGGFNKHQRWSRNMMGENKQQASSRMGIYWYTLRSFKLTGKLEHCLIAGHEWIPARDSLKAPPMDPDGWIPQVARVEIP